MFVLTCENSNGKAISLRMPNFLIPGDVASRPNRSEMAVNLVYYVESIQNVTSSYIIGWIHGRNKTGL